jgi:ABC-type antimicrobial peptide transport system permease subunit
MAVDCPVTDSIAVMESALGRADLQRALEGLVDAGALEVRLNNVEAVNSIRRQVIAEDRARGLLTIGETVLVVLLAAAGFYGTQRYLVAAGRREYAIRASLGAGPRALSALVFRRGLLLGLPGLVLSLPLAFILDSWLYKEDYIRGDYSVLTVTAIVAAVVIGLLALMALASIGPSLQARRTQPAPLLREE